MLRKSTDEDISDEECEKVINPFYDNYHCYVEEYVMPEVIAFYIFNILNENYEKTKAEVIKLLRIKYSLEVISEDPLDLKKI